MRATLTPMIHVPDVRATALWYQSVGFNILAWHGDDDDNVSHGMPPEGPRLDWACLGLGNSRLMLNTGGKANSAPRREVDLYVDLEGEPGVDALYANLRDRVELVKTPYDAFHGNRELIIRDLNGFWITFAQPVGRPGSA